MIVMFIDPVMLPGVAPLPAIVSGTWTLDKENPLVFVVTVRTVHAVELKLGK